MNLFKTLAASSVIALALTGCAVQGNSQSQDEEISTIGITGADLAGTNRDYDMDFADQKLMYACVGLDAYLNSELQNSDGTSQLLQPDEAIDQLRSTTIPNLKAIEDTYPEVNIFAEGVGWELLSPGKNTESYVLFQKFCKTYDQVFKRVQANYAEPITILGACWDIGGMYASLQEKIGDTWIFLQEEKSTAKISSCSQSGYRYGATFEVPRFKSDSSRTVRMTYRKKDGSTLASGKRSWSTPEGVFDATTSTELRLY
jgi:hypothetical protein